MPLYRLASFCEAYSEEWALDQDEVGIVMLLVPLFPSMQEKTQQHVFFSVAVMTDFSQRECFHSPTDLSESASASSWCAFPAK